MHQHPKNEDIFQPQTTTYETATDEEVLAISKELILQNLPAYEELAK